MISQTLPLDGTPMYDELPDEDKQTNAEYVTLPLDHRDANAGTYENRFWASEQYHEPGGPVFIFDSGRRKLYQLWYRKRPANPAAGGI